jgi:hypothetical protein
VAVSTQVHINGAALNALLNGPNGPVAREIQRRGERIRDRMQQTAPRETGNLAQNIRSALVSEGGTINSRVGVFGASARRVPYLRFVIGGTRTPIRPRRARVLRFVVNGRVVYAKEVRGQPANNFMLAAIDAGRG